MFEAFEIDELISKNFAVYLFSRISRGIGRRGELVDFSLILEKEVSGNLTLSIERRQEETR